MKIIPFVFLYLISAMTANAKAFPGDSAYLPTVHYSKKELKKEMDDVKTFDKQVNEWQKAIKQKNADYLNAVFAKAIKLLEKEHSELSNRVSLRSKQLIPADNKPKATSTGTEDKPQVYNSELKDQVVHIDKKEIMHKKAESEYLAKYINVIRNEKAIMTKLKNVKTFDTQTPASTYQEISNDFQSFKKQLNEEIELMKNETGKK